MCRSEAIPPVNRLGRINATLKGLEAVSDEGQDIFALEKDTSTNDELLEGTNTVINNTDPDMLHMQLLNRGRISMAYQLPEDYENLFRVPELSRRSERPLWQPVTEDDMERLGNVKYMMNEWVTMCFNEPEPQCDEFRPGDMEDFATVMEKAMPARLDFDCWISSLLMARIAMSLSGGAGHVREFHAWSPEYGDGSLVQVRLPTGQFTTVRPFIGEAKPGRLIWRRPGGFSHEFLSRFYDVDATIRRRLRRVEETLVAFGRRIARHVVTCVVYNYLMPEHERQRRALLDRRQIDQAVREILGDDWFDLPFDTNNSLRNWSIDDVLKPDAEMDGGWDVFNHADEMYDDDDVMGS